jgi:hypothetical protein
VYTTGPTDTYIEVFGPDDQYSLLTENDDSEDHNARVGFAVSSGERFWISVKGYDETITGSYSIASAVEVYEDDPLEPNNRLEDASVLEISEEWSTSTLVPIGDTDWYFIDVPSAGRLDAMLVMETSGNLDTFLDVFDAGGDPISSDDDSGEDANARIAMLVEDAGRFYVRVKHYDDSDSGSYWIRAYMEQTVLDQHEPDNDMESASTIAVNEEEQRHTFVPGGDVDWLRFTLSSGRTVTIETGGDTDTVMILVDQDENLIAEDDDSGTDGNARIERYLPAGTYFIRISQYDDSAMIGAEYFIVVRSR